MWTLVQCVRDKGIPYTNLSGALFELGPEVAHYVQKPESTAILMNSFWLAGTSLLTTLYFAKEFKRIHSINIAALMDEEDMGGPATTVDFERLSKASPHALFLKDGKWVWTIGKDESRYFKSVDGRKIKGKAYSAPLDVSSLAAATDAQSIRFDFALGETSSRRRGDLYSCETIIEIEGEHINGKNGHFRYEMVHPTGQTPMTALGVAVGIERLLGLEGGAPIKPGLYYPEVIIDPAYLVTRLKEFGTDIKSVE